MKKIIFLLLISILSISCAGQSLSIKEDKLTGIKYISYRNQNYYEESLLRYTIGLKENKESFILSITTGDLNDWIFMESATIYDADTYDKNKTINFTLKNVERDIKTSSYGAYVEEYANVIISLKEMQTLYKILKESKKVNIRYNGRSHYKDKTLSNSPKEAVIKTIEYYYENIAK